MVSLLEGGRRRGLFIGRFNPIHLGHVEAIKRILEEVDEIVIVVGSSQHSHEIDHPFTAGERITMLRLALEENGIDHSVYMIIPVPDVDAHTTWVSLVMAYTPSFDKVYSNEALSRRLFKEAGFPVESIPLYRREIYSATEVRRRMLEGRNWKELVPKSVADYIDSIDGVERLRDLTKSDKIPRPI
jgi:nicotinamide-nucleotide adenylyltransferase